jgi:DNA-directed RNA polymerase sigma subunit (sigma70/sigma32)
MNLKDCNGRVPVFVGGDAPYKLVDFPTREAFDLMYKRSNPVMQDKIWSILKTRVAGRPLREVGKKHDLTPERIRQVEAKFLRKVAASLTTDSP